MRFATIVRRPDRWILAAVLLLCGAGLVMVYSAGSVLGAVQQNDPAYFLLGQIPKLIFGMALMLILWQVDYHTLAGHRALVGALALLGCLALLKVMDGFRWFRIGPFTIQPSEFARVMLVVYLASHFSRHEHRMHTDPRSLVVPAVILVAAAGLTALQPSMSMAVLIFVGGLALFYVAGVRLRWLAIGSAIVGVLAVAVMRAYMWDRIYDIIGKGTPESAWQREQSITAVGSGGIFGLGLAQGLQKYFFLPFPHTDFILGIVGEETGLLGSTALFCIYGMLIYLGIQTARRAPDRFGYYLAAGITINLSMNFVIHGLVNLGLGPVTGVPLPFMSAGGSSLLANLIAMGVLLSVARRTVSARVRDWSAMTRITG